MTGLKCSDFHECPECKVLFAHTAKQKRTLAEELEDAYEDEPNRKIEKVWQAVASKAKEVLLGDDKLHDVASIIIGERSESYQEVQKTAKKILEYLREEQK